MSFYFAACPGPIADHIHLRSGVVTGQRTTIADESLWLDDFSIWARNGGAHTLFDSLNPEGALGVTWSEVVEGFADERDIALTDDDLSRLFHALETAGGDVTDLEGTHLYDLAVAAMADLVIQHARAAFDTDMDETHVHAGEVVTGGPVVLDEEDDIEQYPTSVCRSIEFLSKVPYFKYRQPYKVTHDMTPENQK